MKAQLAGAGNGSCHIDANHVYREYAAAVFEQVHDGSALGGREPYPVMVCGVVIPNGCVEAAASGGKIAVCLVGELITFDVEPKAIRRIRAKNDLRQEIKVFGKLGCEEQVKFACLKRRMRRRDRVSARSASTVHDGKHQRIGDRSHAEVEVKKTSELHHRPTGYRHAVTTHVGVGLCHGSGLRRWGRGRRFYCRCSRGRRRRGCGWWL